MAGVADDANICSSVTGGVVLGNPYETLARAIGASGLGCGLRTSGGALGCFVLHFPLRDVRTNLLVTLSIRLLVIVSKFPFKKF